MNSRRRPVSDDVSRVLGRAARKTVGSLRRPARCAEERLLPMGGLWGIVEPVAVGLVMSCVRGGARSTSLWDGCHLGTGLRFSGGLWGDHLLLPYAQSLAREGVNDHIFLRKSSTSYQHGGAATRRSSDPRRGMVRHDVARVLLGVRGKGIRAPVRASTENHILSHSRPWNCRTSRLRNILRRARVFQKCGDRADIPVSVDAARTPGQLAAVCAIEESR